MRMFRWSIICFVTFMLWIYSFATSILSIAVTCFFIVTTHGIVQYFLNGWLIADKIDGDLYNDERGRDDSKEIFPSSSSCQNDGDWNDLTTLVGVNWKLKKGITVKKKGLQIPWMITLVDSITSLSRSIIHLTNLIKSFFFLNSSPYRHEIRNPGDDDGEEDATGGGATQTVVPADVDDANRVVMKMPDLSTSAQTKSVTCLSTLDLIVKELINDYILLWFQTIHSNSSTLTTCDFIKDCHSLLSAIFTKIIDDHITRLNHNRIYHKLVDIIIHHFEERSDGQTRNEIMRSKTQRFADQSTTSHYNNWRINHSESGKSIDEEIVSRLDCLLDFLLSSVAPNDLINLKNLKCDDLQSRDSLYLMAKEILLFGVSIPIVDIISAPNFVNTSIARIISKALPPEDTKLKKYYKGHKYWNSPSASFDSLTPSSRSGKDFNLSPSPINRTNSEYYPVTRRSMQSLASREDSFVERYSGLEMGLDINNDLFDRINLFANIRIPEAHEAGSRGDKFILYTIVYDGLFEEVETAGINKATVSCLVRKQVTVYRRFSEFLLLHSKLGQNAALRPFLRKIRDPSRLKSYSMFKSKVGKSLTDVRKKFLAIYLIELASIQPLENSSEFREFLSYEATNAPVNFVSGIVKDISSLITPLRIDKAIVSGFKGAVSLVKTVFPIEPLTDDSCYFPGSGFGSSRFKMEYAFVEEKLELDLISSDIEINGDTMEYKDEFSREISMDENYESLHEAGVSQNTDLSSTSEPRVCHSLIDSLGLLLIEYFPLASPTIDLLFFLRNLKSKISFFALFIKLMFGNLIETLLQRQAKKILIRENLNIILELMHESIWPPVQNDIDNIHGLMVHPDGSMRGPSLSVSQKKLEKLLIKFCETKILFFTHFVNDPKVLVPFIVTKLQNHESNKNLIYDLLDVIYQEMRHSKSKCSN